ncbi:MAG: chorismate mutase [Rickettsiales bacterium]|jgi:chorismate mutase/prephenate dehydratase|nr:chorismate mutase [Rickettsiales bacterium]
MSDAKNNTDELYTYRTQIDAIDDKLIALLKERAGIVKQVGRYKHRTNPGICPIRPAREAQMVARIASCFQDGSFNAAAAATMWRTLIGASTSLEADLPISTYVAGGKEELYWLAREYFGPFLPISKQSNVRRVIGEIADGKAAVGIVPYINENDSESWWPLLLPQHDKALRIFAHIPYSYFDDDAKNRIGGFAVAAIEPEETGQDRSIIVLEIAQEVSQSRLNATLESASLDAKWLQLVNPSAGIRHHVLDVEGFLHDNHPQLKILYEQLDSALIKVYIFGSYAKPITIKP